MWILGVDPGKVTGLAVVEVGAGRPTVHEADTCALTDFPWWWGALRPLTPIDAVAVEGWEYQGVQRAPGVAHQAYAVGYIEGALARMGSCVVTLTRGEILGGVFGRSPSARRAGKAQAYAWVRRIVRGSACIPEPPMGYHVADAVAAALAGAARLEARAVHGQGRDRG